MDALLSFSDLHVLDERRVNIAIRQHWRRRTGGEYIDKVVSRSHQSGLDSEALSSSGTDSNSSGFDLWDGGVECSRGGNPSIGTS